MSQPAYLKALSDYHTAKAELLRLKVEKVTLAETARVAAQNAAKPLQEIKITVREGGRLCLDHKHRDHTHESYAPQSKAGLLAAIASLLDGHLPSKCDLHWLEGRPRPTPEMFGGGDPVRPLD